MKAFVVVLFLVGCSSGTPSLSDEFKSDKGLFEQVISDIRTRYDDYAAHYTVKMADGSFSLDSRIMKDPDLLPVSFSGHYLLKRKDIEIVILDSNTIWFRRELSNGFFKIESELLIYSEKNKTYLDSVLEGHSSEKSRVRTLDKNWYFVNVTRHIDL